MEEFVFCFFSFLDVFVCGGGEGGARYESRGCIDSFHCFNQNTRQELKTKTNNNKKKQPGKMLRIRLTISAIQSIKNIELDSEMRLIPGFIVTSSEAPPPPSGDVTAAEDSAPLSWSWWISMMFSPWFFHVSYVTLRFIWLINSLLYLRCFIFPRIKVFRWFFNARKVFNVIFFLNSLTFGKRFFGVDVIDFSEYLWRNGGKKDEEKKEVREEEEDEEEEEEAIIQVWQIERLHCCFCWAIINSTKSNWSITNTWIWSSS